MKSERASANWSEAKRKAREEKKVLTHKLPGWLQECGGKILAIPTAKTAIKLMFSLAARGYGETRIIRHLEENGHKPFGRSGRWAKSYVFYLLHDRRLLGEYQPLFRTTGKPDGEVVHGYYPRILSDEEFHAANHEHSGRKTVRHETTPEQLEMIDTLFEEGKGVRETARQLGVNPQSVYRALIKLGKREPKPMERERTIYLFAGMLNNAAGPGKFRFLAWQGRDRLERNLTVVVDGKQRSFPYFTFEYGILRELQEIDARDILDGLNGHDDVTKLEREFGAVEGEIGRLEADMDANGHSAILGKRARMLEQKLADVSKRLAEAQQKARNPLSASWGEAQTLSKLAQKAREDGDDDLLLRLRSALRRIVQSVEILIVPRGRDRLCAVQLWFHGGEKHRDYLIVHRPPKANASARTEAGRWCDSLDPDDATHLDLRRPNKAKELKERLVTWDYSDWLSEERRF